MTIYDALAWTIEAISNVNLLQVVQALAPVATAFIAYCALKNWKRQDKAKREAEFLDELVEETHTFIVRMSSPVALVREVESGMASHVPTWEDGDQTIKGAIDFIQKQGEPITGRLRDTLRDVQPSLVRLRSLAAKGQIFKFKEYGKCYDALAMLTWQYDRVEVVLNVVGSPTLNWDNPMVLNLLRSAMDIKKDDIQKHLSEHNAEIIKFTRETYQKLYD